MRPYPPLGTLYAAALLRERGYSVAVFDPMLEEPEKGFAAALALHKPKIVAVYEDSFNFLTKMCLTRMRQLAYTMAGMAKEAGAVVLANGSDASDHMAEYLLNGFEYVLLGEAEWTLLEIVSAALAGRSSDQKDSIPGLAFLASGGAIVRTAARSLITNLDHLPFPARDLISFESYRKEWKAAHGRLSLNIVASRGCPYRCNWCAKPIYGNAFHLRSAESVAAEVEQLKSQHGAEHLWFADDIFALNRHWIQDFAEAIESRNCAVPFKMQSRIDLMSEEVVTALARAGCEEVWMGVESGSQKILDAMHKGLRLNEVAPARARLASANIRACFFIQFGYPGETWQDILSTIDLVRRTRPDDVGVSVSYPLPGTEFYERVRQSLGEKTNWSDSGDLAMMFQGTYSGEFYRALHDLLHAEVRQWSPHTEASPESLRDLWQRVRHLEKTCRNPHPTSFTKSWRSDASPGLVSIQTANAN